MEIRRGGTLGREIRDIHSSIDRDKFTVEQYTEPVLIARYVKSSFVSARLRYMVYIYMYIYVYRKRGNKGGRYAVEIEATILSHNWLAKVRNECLRDIGKWIEI